MINGISFFAERIRQANTPGSYGTDPSECMMQIFNLQRHLKKGTRRDDKRDMIFKENLAISQMTDEELSPYWFYIKPENLKHISPKDPRIHFFKDIGWAEPFKDTDAELRRMKAIEEIDSTLN